MNIPFWTNDPSILLNKEYMFEIWPSNSMKYEQKLNAITRLIFLLTILGYILTQSYRIVFAGFITLAGIYVLFKSNKQKITQEILNEGFSLQNKKQEKQMTDTITNPETLETVLKSEFKEGNKKNPFSNVLLTEIMDEPERKSAPPAFNPDVEDDITKNVKRLVQRVNPGIDNTNKQLYSSLWDKFELDQSNRVFYSTANSRVETGNQAALGQYLYNNLKFSSKQSDFYGGIARIQDSYRYTLY